MLAFGIGDFFVIDNTTFADKGVVVYSFKDELVNEFVLNFLLPFRQAYIADENLEDGLAHKDWDCREEAIGEQLPTKASLRSGEFSEILLYYLSICFRCPDANVKPLKWRWKENQDQPCHLSDIVMMKCEDPEHPSKEDYMYVVESKSKAIPPSRNSNSSVMNNAIKGAVKDYASRSGKMIAYLRKWYNREGRHDIVKKVKRFGDSVNVDYDKRYHAAIVVDRDSLQHHIVNIDANLLQKAQDKQIGLVAVPIAGMKDVYERMYKDVVKY